MKRQVLFALVSTGLVSQLFFACQKHQDEIAPAPEPESPTSQPIPAQPGYFVVSATSRSSSPSGRTTQGVPLTEFDLGMLKASKEFLFTIANGGDEPIFDITLTSDKEAFGVSPRRIQTLPGKGGTGIVPLIAVGIIHGRQLNGQGIAPILPQGLNKAVVMMKGKTIFNKDTLEVKGQFTVTVEAKVAALKVFSGAEEIVVSDQITNNERVLLVSAVSPTTIVNTGNVLLHPVIHYYEGGWPNPIVKVTNEFDLHPGETKDISHLFASGAGLSYINFSDNGVVLATSISGRDPVTEFPKIVLFRR